MRKTIAFIMGVLLMGGAGTNRFARAATIEWGDWKVYSSENFQAGRRHAGYPLTHLFDNRPETAWVFSGSKSKPWDSVDGALDGKQFALLLVPKRPVTMDSLRIMNGYNKNADVFKRNNRVTELRVTVFTAHSKTVKTVRLGDKMVWHEVALPRQAVTKLRIELVGFAPGPDNDVCLSEIALFNGPRKIEMHLPQAVVYSDGEGDQYLPPDLLINRKGETIAFALEEETYWSPSGRLVMGRAAIGTLWVADVQKGVVVLETHDSWDTAHWRSDQVIEVGNKLGEKQILRVPGNRVPGNKKGNPNQ